MVLQALRAIHIRSKNLAIWQLCYRCDYPDSVPDCDSESVVGFKCPAAHELPPNAVARRYICMSMTYSLLYPPQYG